MFHLLVPGGRWQTITGMPISSTNFWSSIPAFAGTCLPEAHARAVRSAAIRRDHEPLGVRVALLPHHAPPTADGVDRERRGIVIDAHADPTFVVGDIVDAIGHGAPEVAVDEVMNTHFFR